MNVLYITYDGLTDLIGQSQVLPYLSGCARAGHRLTVISFEKPQRYSKIGQLVEAECRNAAIEWRPQKFHSFPPYLAKWVDLSMMRTVANSAASSSHFDLIHGRSYQASLAGLKLKRRLGIPLLFDMRGFLPDSRREGGRWREDDFAGRWLYARWKAHEATLIRNADHIISLTAAARDEIEHWSAYRGAPVSIVPCCADFDHFTVATKTERRLARKRLGIAPEVPVLGYLGSRGTIYMIGDHLKLFAAIRNRDPAAKAVFLGDPDPSDIFAAATRHGVDLGSDDIRVVQAERGEVPFHLGAIDVATSFYTPTYSSKHVSPTKVAEYLACGIPVIANRAVGDVEAILQSLDAGHVAPDLSDASIEAAADAFFSLRSTERDRLSARARGMLDLPRALSAYLKIYSDPHNAVEAIAA